MKGRAGLMKEASRRLAQNPHDVEGLFIMGDIYYQDQDWEKAYTAYSALLDRMKPLEMNKQLDVAIRYGICALKQTGSLRQKGFLLAETINPKTLM